MRRRAFAKTPGLERYIPFDLFGGQVSGMAFFIFALILLIISAVRPAAFDPIRGSFQSILAPTLRVFSTPFVVMSEGVDTFFSLTHLKAEVEKLRDENERLEEWFNTAQLLQAENQSLRDLLKVKLDPSLTSVTTRVIGDTGGPYAQTLIIGAGTNDGVHKGDVVLGGEGVIGRIMAVQPGAATVLMITDVNSRIPVRVENSNLQAILAGTNGQRLVLERVPEGSVPTSGARVLTSGIGGVFPPDLPIGTVAFDRKNIPVLKPYADFGRLLFVRVVRVPATQTSVELPPTVKETLDKKGQGKVP